MEPVTAFSTSLVLVVLLALVVVLVLRRPLSELLIELCGNNRRARFWTVFAALGLVLASVECSLLTMPGPRSDVWADLPGLRVLLSGLRSGVMGLLVGFGGLGFVLLISIARHNDNQRIEAMS